MKNVPILAGKGKDVKPRVGGVDVCPCLIAGLQKQTFNQPFLYIWVIDEDKEQDVKRLHGSF